MRVLVNKYDGSNEEEQQRGGSSGDKGNIRRMQLLVSLDDARGAVQGQCEDGGAGREMLYS